MVNIWIFYCTWNVRLHVFWQMPYRRTTHLRMLLLEYRWFNRLISDPLWMEQRRSQIRKSGFGFFGFQIQRILFEKGFTRSKIRIWSCTKEREIHFKIENPFLDSPKGTHPNINMKICVALVLCIEPWTIADCHATNSCVCQRSKINTVYWTMNNWIASACLKPVCHWPNQWVHTNRTSEFTVHSQPIERYL